MRCCDCEFRYECPSNTGDSTDFRNCLMWDALMKGRDEKVPPSRQSILEEAIHCTCGQREQDYGTPEDNFKLIGDLWSTYIGLPVKALDVANMMVLLKVARLCSGKPTRDSFVDICGYAACGGEIAERLEG